MEARITDKGMLVNIRTLTYAKEYRETGRWSPNADRYEINYSSILTRLIQDAGRFCIHYASDLFIMWTEIVRTLQIWQESSDVMYVFGIRQDGVDDAAPVIRALEDKRYDYYRAIWALRVIKEGDKIELTMEAINQIEKI